MADLGAYAHGASELRNTDPVEALGAQGSRGQFGICSDGDAVAGGIDVEHVERRRRSDTEPLALADGEVGDALVAAKHLATGGHQFAGSVRKRLALLLEIGGKKLLVIAAGDKADFLRVGLFGELEAMLTRNFAHLRLGHVAERKQGAR